MATMTMTRQDAEVADGPQPGANPFANDYTLMSLSLWWVQRTQPGTHRFDQEVATMMASLARQVR